MDNHAWQPGGLPGAPLSVAAHMPPQTAQGGIHAAEDYLDMDAALHNYLTSIWDSPTPTGTGFTGDNANSAATPLASPGTEAPAKMSAPGIGHAVQSGGETQVAGLGGLNASGQTRGPAGGQAGAHFAFTFQAESGSDGKRDAGERAAQGGGSGGEMTSKSSESGTNGTAEGRQKKRRGGGEAEAPAGKKELTQEKNRIAQKQFRERQKVKMNGLQRQIEELQASLESMQQANSALQSQNGILHKVLAMRDERIKMLQEAAKYISENDSTGKQVSDVAVTLSELHIGSVVRLTAEKLKTMQAEEIKQYWMEYVTEISAVLVDANTNPQAEERVGKLVNELFMLMMRFAALNPVLMMWSKQSYSSDDEEVRKWLAVVPHLGLSKDQIAEIVAIRSMLLDKLKRVLDERSVLTAAIQPSLASSMACEKLHLEYIKTNEAVIQLKENLRSEHTALLDFVSAMLRKILTPIQVARLMVQSYPTKPDILAVASAVQQWQN
ncbi:unnamed protein product [Ostreobium quekettii]|uniref:BZIP domain-containing protein n=1 Tax=Ostreobium quekettii TaxID=121088 RepID=A0A8S1IS20_9CHLO|nr:unnamed protein product [Ostreobium quekettii]|eukprot:evm.model.scf_106.8 EVM.evm.TU.scf_106.8   scf_106:138410-143170(+)